MDPRRTRRYGRPDKGPAAVVATLGYGKGVRAGRPKPQTAGRENESPPRGAVPIPGGWRCPGFHPALGEWSYSIRAAAGVSNTFRRQTGKPLASGQAEATGRIVSPPRCPSGRWTAARRLQGKSTDMPLTAGTRPRAGGPPGVPASAATFAAPPSLEARVALLAGKLPWSARRGPRRCAIVSQSSSPSGHRGLWDLLASPSNLTGEAGGSRTP